MRGLKYERPRSKRNRIVVAPFVGAGIEIAPQVPEPYQHTVAPFVGAGIEIGPCSTVTPSTIVAPFVGAGIEIGYLQFARSWVRGLKS